MSPASFVCLDEFILFTSPGNIFRILSLRFVSAVSLSLSLVINLCCFPSPAPLPLPVLVFKCLSVCSSEMSLIPVLADYDVIHEVARPDRADRLSASVLLQMRTLHEVHNRATGVCARAVSIQWYFCFSRPDLLRQEPGVGAARAGDGRRPGAGLLGRRSRVCFGNCVSQSPHLPGRSGCHVSGTAWSIHFSFVCMGGCSIGSSFSPNQSFPRTDSPTSQSSQGLVR